MPWKHFCSALYLNFCMSVTILNKAPVSARRHSAMECAAPWDVSSERKEILSSSTLLSYLHTSLIHHAIAFEKRENLFKLSVYNYVSVYSGSWYSFISIINTRRLVMTSSSLRVIRLFRFQGLNQKIPSLRFIVFDEFGIKIS